MRWLADLVYLTAGVLTMPVWLVRMIRTGKIRTDWAGRFGRATRLPRRPGRRRVLLHAVSVGEVNAIRRLVDDLAATPRTDLVIASTTDTGIARAAGLFAAHHSVVRYPFDVSFAVDRFLDAVEPDVVVLVELEIWPNFSRACAKRDIPVCVINGRLTRRSADRYRLVRPLMRPSFARLDFAAVQGDDYARRFEAMGVPPQRVRVTGNMKWDTAVITDSVDGADALAVDLGIDRDRPLVVAGSTAPDEHDLLRDAVPDGVQLLCAPRRPEWFDQAAQTLGPCVRRSQGGVGRPPEPHGRFLLDTIGELRQAYALADVVVVGRSFGRLHGSDMMEPVGLGKATVVGPAVADFQDTVDALLAGGGIVQTDRGGLAAVVADLLADPDRRARLAERGRAVVRAQQGATGRHLDLIRATLDHLGQVDSGFGAPKNSPSRAEPETATEEKEERR